jgi:hypothetical protein
MFHSALNYEIVRMRHDELVAEASRRRGIGASERRRWFRRRRAPDLATTGPPKILPRQLFAVPPPRHARQPSGHDERVA